MPALFKGLPLLSCFLSLRVKKYPCRLLSLFFISKAHFFFVAVYTKRIWSIFLINGTLWKFFLKYNPESPGEQVKRRREVEGGVKGVEQGEGAKTGKRGKGGEQGG